MPLLFLLFPMFASLCINMWTRKRNCFSDTLFPTNTFFYQVVSVRIVRIQGNTFCLQSNLKFFLYNFVAAHLVSMSISESLSRFPQLLCWIPWSLLCSIPQLHDAELILTVTFFFSLHHWCLRLLTLNVHTFPSSPILHIPGSFYFFQPKELCIPSVADACFLSHPFCAGFLTALAKKYCPCTLLFPLPSCYLPGSLLSSYPSCRISQPGGMCWRSKLYTIKLLVVFHNNEVSLKPFSADVAVFPQNINFQLSACLSPLLFYKTN